MTDRICTIDGCVQEHVARGFCRIHYGRFYKYGDPSITTRGPTSLTCLHCGAANPPGPRKYCSPACRREVQRQQVQRWNETHPEARAEHARRSQRKRRWTRHNLPLDLVWPTACEACGSSGVVLHVDHDHTCCPGKHSCGQCVRGFLCARCNTGVGHFRDDPARLRAAADYLERARS